MQRHFRAVTRMLPVAVASTKVTHLLLHFQVETLLLLSGILWLVRLLLPPLLQKSLAMISIVVVVFIILLQICCYRSTLKLWYQYK